MLRYYLGMTAAADDRTFVVDTLPVGKVYRPTAARTWYLLRFAPGTAAPARLTRLAVPRLANVTAIALSGSGAELAVATGSGGGALGSVGLAGGMFPPSLPGVLRLYSVSTREAAARLVHQGPFRFRRRPWPRLGEQHRTDLGR